MLYLSGVLYLLLMLFSYALLSRIVLDAVISFAPSWRPKGFVLVFASAVYGVTDKPLRWLRRLVPPVNLGGISLDIGFFLLYFAVVFVAAVLPLPL